jgi:transposase InsO family protein
VVAADRTRLVIASHEGRHDHWTAVTHVRRAVLACRRWAQQIDVSTHAVASALGLSARTLRLWAARPIAAHHGRPTHAVTRAEAQLMRRVLITSGPMASLATLQAACPTASRHAIVRWRTHERARQRRRLHVVQWHHPGRVWAMDFSAAPQRIEGLYRAILHVRDLASGYHLAALPVTDLTSATACGLLRALTAECDAPLVLKLDNGPAFRSAELQAWATTMGTHLLHSPPRYPQYNGAIEASIAAITVRTHHASVQAGHPGVWCCSDLESARQSANVVR